MITREAYSSIGKSSRDMLASWRMIVSSMLKGRNYHLEIDRHAEFIREASGETFEEAKKRITERLNKEYLLGNAEANLKRLRVATGKSGAMRPHR